MKKLVVVAPSSLRSRRTTTAALIAVAFAALAGQMGGQAQSSDPLRHARGYLITGDYVVGGVDLPRGGGTGAIHFNSAGGNEVPADAEVIAAWAIWETIEPAADMQFTGAEFRGRPIDVAKASRLTSLPGTGANCWGSAGGATSILTTYRADVLHLLPKQYDANEQWTGRYLVNDADLLRHQLSPHTITLPPIGTGNTTTTSAGATLVIVWRHPDAPLRKIVIYDGAAVQPQGNALSHTLAGFYRASAAPSAGLTYIAGTGADSRNERLFFNGAIVANNPFPAPIDANSDRGWFNPTFDVSAQMAGRSVHPDFGEVVTTHVDPGKPYDCLSVAAIVFSTTIADVDDDGLPDGIEDAPLGLRDPPTPAFPNGQPLPNLHAMGAQVGQRDLFVEINAMWAPPGTTYGSALAPYNATVTSVEDEHGHDHMPSPAVLKMVGDAYRANGIAAHFDVGALDAYRTLYPCLSDDLACDANPYLVPSAYARGGERIEERACENCQFKDFPGTVGWPFGFRLYRDAPVDNDGEELATLEEMRNASPDHGALRRRFDRNRQPFIHYALFAHARGRGKSKSPCLDASGLETGYDANTPGACAVAPNPLFHTPTSASGIGDLPGANLLVTLGLWDTENFVGSPFVQASTFLHELGHNANLWHGGRPAVFGDKAQNTTTQVEPNCKPNYQSVMSYLFQAHGLMDDGGGLRIDYSTSSHSSLNELGLNDGALFPAAKYRSVWFAPVDSPLAASQGARPARRYCNGSLFDPAAPPDPMLARVQTASVLDGIDWDGDPATLGATQDVNYDSTANALDGFDDWGNLRLDQIGASRSARIVRTASGDLLDFGSGDLLDFGSGDLLDFGSGDLLDFGAGTHIVHLGSGDFFTYGTGDLLDFGSGDLLDFGSGDLLDFGSGVLMFVGAAGDLLDFGSGDLLDFGSGDLLDFGSGDLLDFGSGDLLDFGSGDLLDFGSGDLLDFGSGNGLLELDFETAVEIAPPTTHSVSVCVLGVDCPDQQPGPFEPFYHRFRLDWNAPTFNTVAHYEISRRTAAEATAELIGTVTVPTFIDEEELPNGVEFVYSVRVVFQDGTVSPDSDTVSKAAVNTPPIAAHDSYATDAGGALVVPAPGVLANDIQDVDSPVTSRRVLAIIAEPTAGSVTVNADGSFTYTPKVGFSGSDTFTYRADNGLWPRNTNLLLSPPSNVATVTIDVTATNTPPVCKDISGTVITGGSLPLNAACSDADGDALVVTAVGAPTLGTVVKGNGSFTYTATSPNVGTDTFTYTVSDGKATATANVTLRVIYRFVNVENLPPSNKTFQTNSTVRLIWRWTNHALESLNSANAGAIVEAFACSTNGKLPGAYPLGFFTPQNPGNSNSFTFDAKNLFWRFNWKLQYTDPATGQFFPLPAGTYVVQIKSSVTGQQDPGTEHACANGTKVNGALITVK